jgi:exopolysaccharide biosynthesis protein
MVRLLLSNFEVFGAAAGRIPVGLTIPEQADLAAGAGCRDAVALDGGISAQVAVRGAARLIRMPGWRKVPLMMVVRRR